MISIELQNQMAVWRQKAADNTITLDEMKEAIIVLREARRSAEPLKHEGGGKAPKSKKPTRNADDLLADLGI